MLDVALNLENYDCHLCNVYIFHIYMWSMWTVMEPVNCSMTTVRDSMHKMCREKQVHNHSVFDACVFLQISR